MAKGRRFNPPLDKDGRWFPHIGVTQKTPESITSVTLREPHNPRFSRQIEEKLPPIYKAREKQATHNNFPFSVHDNRHSLRNSGLYADSALGRRKVAPEKRQHVSRNFNLWACDYVPSYLDGFSNNQISYVCPEAVVVPLFRRFPRQYSEVWGTWRFIPERSYAEFLKRKPKVRFAIDKKATPSLEPLRRRRSLDEFCEAGMALGIPPGTASERKACQG
ncbi:hypothetical protein QTO34_005760 [Cnephaeus nilssonii]|uniref:Domain of unknown function with conserved HDNR motif domain-containing protein n=1 Tax=Cnephaeus nilssonii TaxID=3371016 RepID=A0AA40LID5_CNENI|nr:hypothetical protein QTO34_005760 [Eptesicus nilssonii]